MSDPFSIENLAEGAERFGDEVLYLPNATYPVHIRGLGGRSVEYAREVHDQLGRLLGRLDEQADDQQAR